MPRDRVIYTANRSESLYGRMCYKWNLNVRMKNHDEIVLMTLKLQPAEKIGLSDIRGKIYSDQNHL